MMKHVLMDFPQSVQASKPVPVETQHEDMIVSLIGVMPCYPVSDQ